MRIGSDGAVAQPRAAARRRVPPFHRIALDELARGVQQQLPARQLRREEGQRQHVLQLVAIAGGARALRRPGAAPQTRGEQLIGQPVVHEAIEFRLVGLDAQHAERVGPEILRLDQHALGPADAARHFREMRGLFQPAGLAEREHDLRLAARLHFHWSAESRHRALARLVGEFGMAVLDHVGHDRTAAVAADRALARTLREFGCERGRGEGPALGEMVFRIAEVERRAVVVGPYLDRALALHHRLVERDLGDRHDVEDAVARGLVDDAQDLGLAGAAGRREHRHLEIEIGTCATIDDIAETKLGLVFAVHAAQRRECRAIRVAAAHVAHVDRLAGRTETALAHAEGGKRILPRVDREGEDIAFRRHDGAGPVIVGDDMRIGARHAGRDRQRLAVRAECGGSAWQRRRGQKRAYARLDARKIFGRRRIGVQVARDGLDSSGKIARPAVDQHDLGRAFRRHARLEGESAAGLE